MCPMRTLFRILNVRYSYAINGMDPVNYVEGERTMLYMMICKQHRHEEERCWFCQERHFVMPMSEKQIIP